MVVDDDADVRCALVEYLTLVGVASFEAGDGVEALQRVRAGPHPCAIVLDMDMPRMSGAALLAALRSDASIPRIPVVTMTAGNEARSAHADGHLPKPFRAETLLAALYAVCRSCAACDGEGPVVGSIFCARRRADATIAQI